jgi:hypothetical protein
VASLARMAGSGMSEHVEPHKEAYPIAWEDLTDEQQKAGRHACALLGMIAEKKWEAPPQKSSVLDLFLPPIDAERVTHTVLLDGARGSGKTMLLVTILDTLGKNLRGEGHVPKEQLERHTQLASELNVRGKAIVPVGLVDLQPLPRSTNLLLYIIGRFERVVEAIEQSTGHEGARSPWNAVGDDEPTCRRRWRDILRGAAIGWDGNLAGRRANLDPEAYALEAEQAERQRLDVVTSYRRFVDALVEDWSSLKLHPKSKPPLFVISIDDADMNPARSVELLDLVRTLWHPRVAFLLTGHTELFEEALRIQTLGVLREPIRGLMKLPGEVQRSLHARMHERIAYEFYQKVIPEQHR